MEEKINDPLSGAMPCADRRRILYRCLITAAAVGILAHSFMLFNKIGWHDEYRHTFDVGATYPSGRWALGFLAFLVRNIFGMTVSLPVFNGFASLLFIALSAWLVILRFEIRRTADQILITALMISFPVVTATFSYIFTAPYYFFSLLCATAGAYLITGARTIPRTAAAVGLLAFSMGIYQAYIASAVCFVFCCLLVRGLDGNADAKRWILSCLSAAAALAAGLLLYLVLNRLILHWKGLEMGSYQGLDSMTRFGPAEILKGIGRCYIAFAKLFVRGYQGIFYLLSTRAVLALLCLATFLEIVILARARVKTPLQGIRIGLMLAVSPVVLQMIELMTANSGGSAAVHTLMVYSLVYLFILPVALLRELESLPGKKTPLRIRRAVVCALAFFTVYFTFYANAAYFKAWIYKEQAEQFYNRLIVRVESEEGYDPEMKIALVGNFDERYYTHYPELDPIRITFYQRETLISNNAPGNRDLQTFFRYYNNFTPRLLTEDQSVRYADVPEVREMPCYPADGSVKIIGDTVVVRLSP